MQVDYKNTMTRERALSNTPPVGYDEACQRLNFVRQCYEASQSDAAARSARHREDIEIIGTRLIYEAEDRGWCDVYDDVISELNEKLFIDLEERRRDFTVEVQAMVTFKINVEDQTSRKDAEELAASYIEHNATDYIDDVYEIDVRSAEVE